MVRAVSIVVLAGAASGCDVLFDTPFYDPAEQLCGPYNHPTPIAFDAALGQPTDFSVAADGLHGLVFATYHSITGPTPILYDAPSSTWLPDDTRLANSILAKTLSGGHMGTTGDVFGWIDHNKNPLGMSVAIHYAYVTTWGAVVPNVAESTVLELVTGNEVETDAGSNAKTRYVVELAQDFEVSMPKRLEILAAAPASEVFKPSGFVDPINNAALIQPTGAALSGDHSKLVYTAFVNGSSDGHIYVSPFEKFQFAPGDPIGSLAELGKTDDQPWINGDCSQIWFRRDGVTLTAQKR